MRLPPPLPAREWYTPFELDGLEPPAAQGGSADDGRDLPSRLPRPWACDDDEDAAWNADGSGSGGDNGIPAGKQPTKGPAASPKRRPPRPDATLEARQEQAGRWGRRIGVCLRNARIFVTLLPQLD
ncbi:unnamed protein product, partial [Phaeothamnion confervicola]